MIDYRLAEYPNVKGFIIEARGSLDKVGVKLSKSTPSQGPWYTLSNWSTPEARGAALADYIELTGGSK